MCDSREKKKTVKESKIEKVAKWLIRIKVPHGVIEAGNHRIGKVAPTKLMLRLPEHV